MGTAPQIPPDYDFRWVMQHPLPHLDPRNQQLRATYAEPQRWSCDLLIGGKRRSVVCFTTEPEKERARKQGWRDVTETFRAEWKRDAAGKWAHTPLPPTAPIREPDKAPSPPAPQENAAVTTLLDMPVKDLIQALATGAYDRVLAEAIRSERKGQGRRGALSALTARLGVARRG